MNSSYKNRLAAVHHMNNPLRDSAKDIPYNFPKTRRCSDCNKEAPRTSGKWFANKWYCYECSQ